MDNVMEEYHAIFAERMIQHPAVQRICNRDYSSLFTQIAEARSMKRIRQA
jgi:LysR family transcriptional activator of nhaA